MHISEGVLSPQVLVAGAALATGGVALGIRKMEYDEIPKVAVLTSALFVASLIHVRFGPSSAHPILNGLAGVMLGWAVFPAFLVALFLQAILPIQFGGLTTLGVNTLNMAVPAIICYYAFNRVLRRARSRAAVFTTGTAAGASAVLLGVGLMVLSLWTTGKGFRAVAVAVGFAHIPVIVIDGLLTGSIVVFLRRVRPVILEAHKS